MSNFVAGEFSTEHKVAALLQELLSMDDCSEGCLEISAPQVTGLIGLSGKHEVVAAQVTPDGPAGIEALERLLKLDDGSYIFHEGRFVEGEELFSMNSHALKALTNKLEEVDGANSGADQTIASVLKPLASPAPSHWSGKKNIASTSGFYEKLKAAITLESKTNLLAMTDTEAQLILRNDSESLPTDAHSLSSPLNRLDNAVAPSAGSFPPNTKTEQENTTTQPSAKPLQSQTTPDPNSPRRSRTIEIASVRAQEREKKISQRQMELGITVALVLFTPGFAFLSWSALDEITEVQRVKALYNKGRLTDDQRRKVVALTDHALKRHADSPKLHYYRGLCLRQLGFSKEALDQFIIGLKLAPSNSLLLDETGYTEVLLGDYKSAVDHYTALINHKTYRSPNAYAKRAFAFMALGDYAAAQNDYLTVRKTDFDKKSIALHLALCDAKLGRIKEALDLITETLHADSNDPDVYTTQGVILSKAKNYPEARAALLRSIAMRPTPDAYLAVADIATAQEDDKNASEFYTKFLSLRPNDRGILLARGQAYFRLGELGKALADYNALAALKAVGNDCSLYVNRAAVFLALGKVDQAIADCQKARDFDPHNPQARLMLAQSFAKNKQYLRAVDLYSSLILDDPKNVDLLMQCGYAEMAAGFLSQAQREFESAVNLTRNDPVKQEKACLARGLNCLKQGQYIEADVDFNNVLKLNGHNAEAKALKASIAAKVQKPKPVAESMPERRALEPDEHASTTELINTGYSLMKAGDNESAMKFLVQAVEREPGNRRARQYLAYLFTAVRANSDAVEQFDALEQLGPLSTKDVSNYVEVLTATGDRERATAVLETFLKSHPNDLKARANLANAFVALDKLRDFQRTCIEGMKLAKTNEDYLLFKSLLDDTLKKIPHKVRAKEKAPAG